MPLLKDYSEDYVKLIRLFQPKPGAPGEKSPFSDDEINLICKGLDVAAAPLKIGGVVFPPLMAVGKAIGVISKILQQFSNQDKMKELTKRINAKIQELGKTMDTGFDNLQKVIAKTDFLVEVVSPARELFDAYNRYAESHDEADKEEFLEIYDVKKMGGLEIGMLQKLSYDNATNFLKIALIADNYRQKQFEETMNFILLALYQTYAAHTFYYTLQYESHVLEEEERRFANEIQKIVDELEKINTWKESAYFNEDFIRKLIEKDARGWLGEYAAQPICDILTKNYTWDRFIVLTWEDNYTKDDDGFVRRILSKANTLEFQITTAGESGRTSNLLIHRIRDNMHRNPINYKERHAVAEEIHSKLRNDRTTYFNVLDAMKITDELGFGLWMYFSKNEISFTHRGPAHIGAANSPGADSEFYGEKCETHDAPFGMGRWNHFWFTY